MKILLVDDSELATKHIALLLKKLGFTVVPAASYAEGLKKYQEDPEITAVLSDYVLDQGLTGLALLQTLGKKKPTAILTHADLPKEDQVLAQTLGIKILTKPIHGKEEEFLAHVKDWLSK